MGKIIEEVLEIGMQAFDAIIVLIAGFIGIKLILRITKRALKRTSLDIALHMFILNATRVVLWIALIVAVLGCLGIQTSSFIAIISAGGVAVALALKDSLGNVAGGILLLISQPFGKGDAVDINGTFGIVEKIDLLTTTLKTLDNKVITLPNGVVTTAIITNYSKEETRRVDCVFRIGLGSSIEKAKETIMNVIETTPLILKEPEPEICVISQDDSAVNIRCNVWCETKNYWNTKYFMEENIKLAFDETDIAIPHSQVDVRIVK